MKLCKNKRAFLVLVLTAAILGTGGVSLTGCKDSATATEQAKQYTCPMHPEVVQDKPGKCPKCGMELVEKR